MLYEIVHSKAFRLIALLIGVFIVALITLSILSRTDSYHLQPTTLQYNKATTQLRDGKIYAYNGASFYSVDIAGNDTPKVYSQGQKLPSPQSIVWAGTRGVLMDFKGSFNHTQVETFVNNNNLSYDALINSSWYLDFSTGELSYVGPTTILNNFGVYSASEKGIYYSAKGDPDNEDGTLHFFDVIKKADSTLTDTPEFANISDFISCSTPKAIGCFIATPTNSPNDTALYSISPDKKVRKILAVTGQLLPTSNGAIIMELKTSDTVKNGDDADLPVYAHATLRNLTTNRSLDIDGQFYPGAFVPLGDRELQLATIGTQEGGYSVYRPGLLGGVVSSHKRITTNNLVIDSVGDNGAALLNTTNGSAVLFSRSASLNTYITPNSSNLSVASIRSCHSNLEQDSIDKTYVTFYIDDTSEFTNTVKKISTCLNKNTSDTTQWRFAFASISTTNGRITSD